MPLPMVHLAVVREFAQGNAELLNCPEFFLGSISPDSIHMRRNTGREDKGVTHLQVERSQWTSNVLTFIIQNRNNDEFNFLLGYGIHILTDILWNETIYNKFKLNYENDLNPIQEIKWAYYNDTDRLDFELYNMFTWRQDVWNMLEIAKCIDVESILSSDEISAWNKRTLHWYDRGDSQHKYPIKYITVEDIIEFTQNSARRIKVLLESR